MIVTKHFADYITYTIFELDHGEYWPRYELIPETYSLKKVLQKNQHKMS